MAYEDIKDLAQSVAQEISAKLEQSGENLTENISEDAKSQTLKNINEIKKELYQIDDSDNPPDFSSQELFLQNLKERILVLFEGLNDKQNGDIKLRLDITIKFLEFLLATIENRLDGLSKQ